MIKSAVVCDGCKRPIATGCSVVSLEFGVAVVELNQPRWGGLGRETARGAVDVCGDCMGAARPLAALLEPAWVPTQPRRSKKARATGDEDEGGEES